MSNPFIDYLNSLHNANASNENALAESQVFSNYYEKIMVERNVGKYLIRRVAGEKPCTVLLTGHAGDGKTSIIIQVLQHFGLLLPGVHLSKYELVELPEINRELLYVKDMSELTESEQDQYLAASLEAPKQGNSAILISNTGPLINSLKRYFEKINSFSGDLFQLEMQILEKMDSNDGEEIEIGDCSFQIINISRLDNISFVPKIIENILKEEIWQDCVECSSRDGCPLYFNYKVLYKEKSRVINFCRDFYRWLYENDKRVTIRQMLAQISYAVTGGIQCDQAKNLAGVPSAKFEYSFANLFFGFKGTVPIPSARQIRGIRELNGLSLDEKSLTVDYQLFVRNDFTCFSSLVRNVVEKSWRAFLNHNSQEINMHGQIENLSAIEMRRAIRRFYLFFSYLTKEDYNRLLDEIYSPIYSKYLYAYNNQLSPSQRRPLQSMIVSSLYQMFLGLPQKNNKKLQLTLRRENKGVQSVQLLQGEIDLKDIQLEQVMILSPYNNDYVKYHWYLKTKQMDEPFAVSLPLLDYFNKINNGAIATKLNPALSHGIDKLKSNLLDAHREESDQIKLLVNTVEGPVIITCFFDGDELYVEE